MHAEKSPWPCTVYTEVQYTDDVFLDECDSKMCSVLPVAVAMAPPPGLRLPLGAGLLKDDRGQGKKATFWLSLEKIRCR